MSLLKRLVTVLVMLPLIWAGSIANSAEYVIDTKGSHAFVQFSIKHLGYSWLHGRFNRFDGGFSYDEANPGASKVSVIIDTNSVDSNHAERDKHLRSDDFLDVKKFPKATFESTKVVVNEDGSAKIYGNLTLKGVTKELVIDAYKVGMGKDPWGGFRAGFEGKTRFALKDFNIMKNLGPMSQHVEMTLSIEGIRK